jgi:uncharacterized protein YdaU (DUF1376 family)
MTNEEVGVYIKLLCYMWEDEECSLPNDIPYLSKICHADNTVIAALYHCFYEKENKIMHKRLDKERKKQDEYREKQSSAGKIGMEKRWGARNDASSLDALKKAPDNTFKNNAQEMPKVKASHNGVITSHKSSSSSPIPTSSPKKNIYGEKFETLNFMGKGVFFNLVNKHLKTYNQIPSQSQLDHWIDNVIRKKN